MNTIQVINPKFKVRYLVVPLVLMLALLLFVPTADAQPTESDGYYHTVQYGETLSHIAWYYGSSVSAIAYANNIVNPDYIWAGMVLYVPAYGHYGDYGTGGYGYYCRYYHTVQYGENLFRLGMWYGVSPYMIAEANGVYNLNLIYQGQTLCIP